LLGAAIVLVTIAAFSPVRHHGFVNIDDAHYVAENPAVLSGLTWNGVAWAFTTGHAGNWHPLTWISHMADVELFGLDPGAFHVTNLALHTGSALVLFGLLVWLTNAPYRSAFVAALFAVHPLRVESVAWIAERKDVLSVFLGLATLLAYAWYARAPSLRRYGLVFAGLALGLMAKPMLVTLPCVMLLLDVWPLRRLTWPIAWTVVREKIPLFALVIAASIVTFAVQHQAGAVRTLETISIARRATTAVVAYGFYLVKTIWPSNLALLYPYPETFPIWKGLGALAVLALITIACVKQWRERPQLLVGWLWFVGVLVPVSGVAQVGSQPWADRFTYLPSAGLFVLAVWGLHDVASRWRHGRRAMAVAAVAITVACAALTYRQTAFWSDGVTLWTRALAVTESNFRAHTNLGQALAAERRLDAAIVEYRKALSIRPDLAEAHNYLGVALAEQGRVDEAIAAYQAALRHRPGFAEAGNNLGLALAETGRMDEAVRQFESTVRHDPEFTPARANLGIALAETGRPADAVRELTAVVEAEPQSVDARLNLATALLALGRADDALVQYDFAAARTPAYAPIHRGRGTALRRLGRQSDALVALTRAVQLAPEDPETHFELGMVLAAMGRGPDAIAELQTVLRLDPNHAGARELLARLTGETASTSG
jgi:tetratricopeptide (TPR) repeat protein